MPTGLPALLAALAALLLAALGPAGLGVVEVEAGSASNIQPCHLTSPHFVQTSRGLVTDGSPPLAPYPHSVDCLWIISPETLGSHEYVRFSLVTAELAPGDYIKVYYGPSVRDSLLAYTFLGGRDENSNASGGSGGHDGIVRVHGHQGSPITVVFKSLDGLDPSMQTTTSPFKLEGFSAVYEVVESIDEQKPPQKQTPTTISTSSTSTTADTTSSVADTTSSTAETTSTSTLTSPKTNTPPEETETSSSIEKTDQTSTLLVDTKTTPKKQDTDDHEKDAKGQETSSEESNSKQRDNWDELDGMPQLGDSSYTRAARDVHIRGAPLNVQVIDGYCVNDCYENLGRGKCVAGKCVCNPGFTSGDCHNDDIHVLSQLYLHCDGKKWKHKDRWSPIDSDAKSWDESTFHGPCRQKPKLNSDKDKDTPDVSQYWYGVTECISGRIISLELSGNQLVCENAIDKNAEQKYLELKERVKLPDNDGSKKNLEAGSKREYYYTPSDSEITEPINEVVDENEFFRNYLDDEYLRYIESRDWVDTSSFLANASDIGIESRDSFFKSQDTTDKKPDTGSSEDDLNAQLEYWKVRSTQAYSPVLPLYLRKIDLSDNKIEKFPSQLDRLVNLNIMKLNSASLRGFIPIELKSAPFTSLSIVDLSDNNLVGTLFDDIRWSQGLSTLMIANNKFEGFLTELLTRVSKLTIEGNTIWCPTPETYDGKCTQVSISSLMPQKASMSGGEIVVISGEHLPEYVPVYCNFGDTPVLANKNDNGNAVNSLTCRTPSHIPGVSEVGLYYNKRKLTTTTLQFTFTIECPEGSYIERKTETKCISCPRGGYCPGGKQYPQSKAGYVDSPLNNATFQAFLPCYWAGACIGNNTCSDAYDGPRCSKCVNGHVKGSEGCVPCGAMGTMYALLIVLWIFLMPLWWLRQAILGSTLSSFGILVTFFQIVGLFHQYPIEWPLSLKRVVSFTSVTVLNTDSLNLECALGLNFYGRLAFVWFLPVIFAMVCGLYVIGISYRQAEQDNHIELWKRYVRKWRSFVINGSISALSLLQIPLTDRSLRMFTCVKDQDDDRYYIASSPEVTCFTTEYYIWRPLAFCATVIYGLGIPFWFFYIVYRNRNRLLNVKVFRRYGSLYSNYAIRAWYWPPFSTLWSMAFTFIPAIFRHVETEFMFLSIIMMYINLFATMYFQPYAYHRNNSLTILSWSVAIIFLIGGLIIGWTPINSGGTSTGTGSSPVDLVRGSGINPRDYSGYVNAARELVSGYIYKRDASSAATPEGKTMDDDNSFMISITIIYLFSLNVAILTHGMIMEWQQYNYDFWLQRPLLKRLVQTKVWLFIFPYDHTLKLEQVDNPLISPTEIIGHKGTRMNRGANGTVGPYDFDGALFDINGQYTPHEQFELNDLQLHHPRFNEDVNYGDDGFDYKDTFPVDADHEGDDEFKFDNGLDSGRKKKKGKGAKFMALDNDPIGLVSPDGHFPSGDDDFALDIDKDFAGDVYSDDLDSDTLEGIADFHGEFAFDNSRERGRSQNTKSGSQGSKSKSRVTMSANGSLSPSPASGQNSRQRYGRRQQQISKQWQKQWEMQHQANLIVKKQQLQQMRDMPFAAGVRNASGLPVPATSKSNSPSRGKDRKTNFAGFGFGGIFDDDDFEDDDDDLNYNVGEEGSPVGSPSGEGSSSHMANHDTRPVSANAGHSKIESPSLMNGLGAFSTSFGLLRGAIATRFFGRKENSKVGTGSRGARIHAQRVPSRADASPNGIGDIPEEVFQFHQEEEMELNEIDDLDSPPPRGTMFTADDHANPSEPYADDMDDVELK